MKKPHSTGNIKYSNVKLTLVAFGKNRTGYSIRSRLDIIRPVGQVITCFMRKATCATLTLSLGMNITNATAAITHEDINIRYSMVFHLLSDHSVFQSQGPGCPLICPQPSYSRFRYILLLLRLQIYLPCFFSSWISRR